MAQELAAQFPSILQHQDTENEHLLSQFAMGQFWNPNGTKNLSHRDAIFAQVSLGTFTHDLLAGFGVAPDAAIGYSLGESTALFATRAWPPATRDQMLARMHHSTLFTSDLAGPCNAARAAWKLPHNEPVDWIVGVVDRSSETVQQALHRRSRVYLLIVNTFNECVIGGQRHAVNQLVAHLACTFHPVEGVTTVHCEVAKSVEDAYRQLHLFDVTPPKNVRFYSGSRGESYEVTRESAADSIVRQAIAPFDFTKVIQRAYADGIRLFVEMGPGASCTRMIDQILTDKPHLARSICVPAQNNTALLLRTLAHLASEGVPVNLQLLYGEPVQEEPPASRTIAVMPGGEPFKVPLPPTPSPPSIAPWKQPAHPNFLLRKCSPMRCNP